MFSFSGLSEVRLQYRQIKGSTRIIKAASHVEHPTHPLPASVAPPSHLLWRAFAEYHPLTLVGCPSLGSHSSLSSSWPWYLVSLEFICLFVCLDS